MYLYKPRKGRLLPMATKHAKKKTKKHTSQSTKELTLRDRLSRLEYRQACRLLGDDRGRLIIQGGKYDNFDLDRDVYLGDDLFRLNVNGAVATITLMGSTPQRLQCNCTICDEPCEHVGAALSLILEEKTALGLAKAPPERVPIESLSEEDLIKQAIEERRERADTERMKITSTNPRILWTDYLVTSGESGKTYRVALRGWEPGDSFCSCPDYRVNTLGICKHVLRVQNHVRKKFSESTRRRPYRQKDIAVHLQYGHKTELRLLLPDDLSAADKKIVSPLADKAIDNVHDLLGRIQKLTAKGHDVTIYPDAEEYIDRRLFLDRIADTVAKIRKDPAAHPLRKKLLKSELLPYQMDGIAFAAGAGRAILADDMGLGKTIQGIGVAELLAQQADISRVLVICPTTLKSQWRSEIHRFSDRDCRLILGSAADRARQYDNKCFFTICNYEQVLRDILAIERVSWDLIILDEGQRIKNWEAKTTKVVKALRSPFALVLSGTPLENRLDDLYSVAQFVDDRRLGPAFRFFNRHRIVDESGKVLGYKNLDQLRAQLKPILLRRTRESVMKELPPRTTDIVRIEPTEEQLDLHGTHMRVVSSIVRKSYISEMDMLRLKKALLMCRMAADSTFLVDKYAPGYSSKLDRLDELISELFTEENRKVVLFSEWTTMLNLIQPFLEKRNIEYVRLDGSIPQKKRQQLVNRFQQDESCRLFVTTNAGSTGLNLQAADTVINVDLPWNPAVLEQRIARAHRMGQTRPVQVYVLVTEGTIEENLLATLSAKQELALAALDAESDVQQVDMVSGMEELKRRLEILLGAKPEAPVDESERNRQTQDADRLNRQQRVAAAGGQLVTAAFGLLGELLPQPSEPSQQQAHTQAVETIKHRLAECIETDDDGTSRLTIALPDTSSLDAMADALARLTSISQY